MATIRAYTTIEQSRKLAEILPLESADIRYKEYTSSLDYSSKHCWSLAALFGVLPNGIVMNKDSQNGMYHFSSKYIGTSVTADNPVDACVDMIEKLHELNLL